MIQKINLNRDQVGKLNNIINQFDYINNFTIELDKSYDNEDMTLVKITLFDTDDTIIDIT